MKLHDSGKRETFQGGAVRDDRKGKGRYDLVTPVGLRRLSMVYEAGAEKYMPRNWEKGMPHSRFLDSAKRHINCFETICLYLREGIPLDQLPASVTPDEDHLAQAVWNLMGLMHMQEIRPDLDDLSKGGE